MRNKKLNGPSRQQLLVNAPLLCSVYPPLQPFPLQEAREVHGLLVGGKWNPTQIITNYSAKREREKGDDVITMEMQRQCEGSLPGKMKQLLIVLLGFLFYNGKINF